MTKVNIDTHKRKYKRKYPQVIVVKEFGMLEKRTKSRKVINYKLLGFAKKIIKNSMTSGLQEALDMANDCGAEYVSVAPPDVNYIKLDEDVHTDSPIEFLDLTIETPLKRNTKHKDVNGESD